MYVEADLSIRHKNEFILLESTPMLVSLHVSGAPLLKQMKNQFRLSLWKMLTLKNQTKLIEQVLELKVNQKRIFHLQEGKLRNVNWWQLIPLMFRLL